MVTKTEFLKLGLVEEFSPYFSEAKITKPTDVQRKVIPLILEEESTFVLAQTGSGKTLAYALPLVQKLKMNEEHGQYSSEGAPQILVLVPTKELAAQVFKVFKEISYHQKCRVRMLTGGDSFEKTKNLSRNVVDILIATPTRLVSSLKKKEIKFENLEYVVLDEADTLMEMGFNKDIQTILNAVKNEAYKLHLFSATMPKSIEQLVAETYAHKNLKKIQLAGSHQVQSTIATFNIGTTPANKMELTHLFLTKTAQGKGMIFCNQKNIVENLANFLKTKKQQFKYKILHGDLPKEEREQAIKQFIDGKIMFLICSDVAARGIDVKDLEWVLNYDLPKMPAYYLHRAGRTGRMGKKGNLYNFVTTYDHKFILAINDSIKKQKEIQLDLIQIKQMKKPNVIKHGH